MTQDNGGSAFPVTPTDRSGQIADTQLGMTLRDYFAAKALSNIVRVIRADDYQAGQYAEACAEAAYLVADAMLAERNKP